MSAHSEPISEWRVHILKVVYSSAMSIILTLKKRKRRERLAYLRTIKKIEEEDGKRHHRPSEREHFRFQDCGYF